MATSFPLPYTLMHRAYTGAGEDEHGNEIETWADPVPVKGFWGPPTSTEPMVVGHDQVTVDLMAVVASETPVGPHDKMLILGQEFDVIGWPEDHDHGPWWKPGVKPVNLRRVEG